MRFIILIVLYDFMQVLNINRRLFTKYGHFSKHILFAMIYLLQKQKLKYNNYSEQQINMRHFIQSKEHDMNMNANIQCMNMHDFL
jgi:hypothetical protein